MTRHRVAWTLAATAGVSLVLLTIGVFGYALRNQAGLDDASTSLMLTLMSILVGVVSGYLARKADDTESYSDETGQDRVGGALAVALGGVLLVMSISVLIGAAFASLPGLSGNAVSLLGSAFGGALGAIGAYLGVLLPSTPDTEQDAAPEVDASLDAADDPTRASHSPPTPTAPSSTTPRDLDDSSREQG